MRPMTDERSLVTAPDVPELGAIVQVKGDHRARRLRRFHPFDDHVAGGFRQCRENAAAVEPAHTAGKDRFPVKVSGFELRRGFVRAVVKHDRRADTLPAIAVNRRHVRTVHAVVLECFVKGLDAHRFHALGDQIADGIVDHRGRDACLHAEAVGQVGGAVELAAADVDRAVRRFPKRDDPRVEAVDKRADGDKIQRAFLTDIQTVFHAVLLLSLPTTSPPPAGGDRGEGEGEWGFVGNHFFFHTVEVTLPP